MNDPFQSYYEAAGVPQHDLAPGSRYYHVGTAIYTTEAGERIAYLRRRFIPAPAAYQIRQVHRVTAGERLDKLSAHYLGDPEQFWQIADANSEMQPEALTEEVDRIIRIPEGRGISGF